MIKNCISKFNEFSKNGIFNGSIVAIEDVSTLRGLNDFVLNILDLENDEFS